MKYNRLIVGILVAGFFWAPVTPLTKSSTDIGSTFAEEQLSANSDPAKLKAKLAEIDKRINESPSAKLYAAKANVLAFLNDEKNAIAAISKAIILSPHNGNYYAYRGLLHGCLGNADDTIRDIEKAKSYGVSDPDYLGMLALAQAGKLDNKKALENAEKALKQDPKNFSALHALGRIHTNLKKYQKAVNDFTLAIEQKNHIPEIYLERSAAWAKLGNKVNSDADKRLAEKLKSQLKK